MYLACGLYFSRSRSELAANVGPAALVRLPGFSRTRQPTEIRPSAPLPGMCHRRIFYMRVVGAAHIVSHFSSFKPHLLMYLGSPES